jgi:DNA-binding MarR family transcriptional regulator
MSGSEALETPLRQPTRNKTAWRHANVGRLLNNAIRRFEGRVLDVMREAGYEQTRMAHIGLTRNLDVEGTRLTELARRASITKQAMSELVEQCEVMGLVARSPDPSDGRARIITFTAVGLAWLDAFRVAIDIAEQDMRAQLGAAAMDTLMQALATYGADFGTLNAASEG